MASFGTSIWTPTAAYGMRDVNLGAGDPVGAPVTPQPTPAPQPAPYDPLASFGRFANRFSQIGGKLAEGTSGPSPNDPVINAIAGLGSSSPEQTATNARSIRGTLGIVTSGGLGEEGAAAKAASLAEKQLAALRQSGRSEAEIADFAKTMAPSAPQNEFSRLNSEDLRLLKEKAPESMQPDIDAELQRRVEEKAAAGRAIDAATAQQAIDPGILTREIQAAVGTPGKRLAEHPVLGPKIAALGTRTGGDIGAATRLVMSGDPEAISVLGEDLTTKLVQNKVADIVRRTGAPQEVVDRGLGIMLKDKAALDATPEQIVTTGQNAAKVEEAITTAAAPPGADSFDRIVGSTGKMPPQTMGNPDAFVHPSVAGMKPTYRIGMGDPSPIVWADQADKAIYTVTNSNGIKSGSHDSVLAALHKAGYTDSAIRTRGAEIRAELKGQYRTTPGDTLEVGPAGPGVSMSKDIGTVANPTAGQIQTEQDISALRKAVSGGGAPPPAGPRLTATGGSQPSNVPLGPATQKDAGEVAINVALEVNALMRAATAGGDLSVVLLQGGPLLAKDITKLPFYMAEAARGGAQRPYFQSAFGRLGQALVAGPDRMNEITAGFRNTLEANGIRPGVDVFISDPLGAPLAREEFAAGKIIQMVPGLGLLYRQGNFATNTFLNALRVGEAVNLKRAYEAAGLPFNAPRVGHLVNIGTGRGDLPFANGEYAQKTAEVMQGVFFGPRLMTAAVQNVTDTVQSLRNIGWDVLSRRKLDPVDVARVHTTAAFVAAGWGFMKLAEASGLAIGTDPEKTDFGRITLPGGHRIDFWGPFNEEARLLAREIAMGASVVRGEKPKFGAPNGLSLVQDYLRSKLGPVASAAASVAAGTNMAGQTPAQVIRSTIDNPNPISNPTSMVPLPFTAQTAAQAFNPAQGGQGGWQGAAETALSALGVSVLPPRTNIPRDGLGVPETDPNFGKDTVIQEHDRLMGRDPNFAKTPMEPPDATLGSKGNSFKLPPNEAEDYIRQIGNARRVALGNLIYSDEYQKATLEQQEKMFNATKEKADSQATVKYLAKGVIDSTDPIRVTAEAVTGFKAQGNNKDRAYWIALLDRAGKLTPEVAKAIDASNVALPGQPAPISVEEYRKAAPLVHEYLAHAPYGTDAHPYGTPADWAAAQAAHQQESQREDQLIRTGTRPDIARNTAHLEVLRSLQGVQRNIFVNGSQLENPARRQLSQKYGSMLDRFLGASPQTVQETESAYKEFAR